MADELDVNVHGDLALDSKALTNQPVTVSRAALRLELLEMEIRLKEYFVVMLEPMRQDIRILQEDGRAAKLAVTVARDTLATETERRREELAVSIRTADRKWSLRGSKTAWVMGFIAFGALAISAANAIHTIFG